MKVKCPICNGLKSLVSLGCMKKECYECDGKGYVDKKEAEEVKIEETDSETPDIAEKPHKKQSKEAKEPFELADGVVYADPDTKEITAEALPHSEVITDIPSEVAMTAGGTRDD